MRWFFHLFLVVLLTACGERSVPPVHSAKELVVLTRSGPTTYTTDDTKAAVGFEHDLASLFAEELELKVRFVVAASDADIVRRLKAQQAHMAAAWLTPDDDPELRRAAPYMMSSNILATHEASLPITEIGRLAGRTVYVVAGSQQAAALREVQASVPDLHIVDRSEEDELGLLEGVAAQRFDAALVDQAVFDIASNYYPELQGTLEIGKPQPVVWMFPADGDPSLIDRADAFIARIQQDGTLARLKDRYFGHVERLDQGDVVAFIERIRSVLPQYRPLFQTAQASTGIDWRLLAALAYQESQWDPLATSPTGVRGMMMLTEDTADHLRVSNRLDPKQSIRAGARYLGDLRDALPDSVREPDRLWLALAAYNLGMGHLNGGRAIAESLKANPDSWYEMKKVLPLLSRPQYYKRLKSGKARGGEAVILVENIRIYADILKRYEAPHLPPERSAKAGETARKSGAGKAKKPAPASPAISAKPGAPGTPEKRVAPQPEKRAAPQAAAMRSSPPK